MSELNVRREWRNIDLLLVDDPNRLVVIIENKVHSGEHSDQLRRYAEDVEAHYPGWNILKLFLTPEGGPPSEADYIPISYALICELVESLAKSRASTRAGTFKR